MNSVEKLNPPVKPSTIPDLIADQAAARVDTHAIIAPGLPPLSYSGVGRMVERSIAELRESGIRQRDIVAIALPNGPEMATGFLALASAAVCAPLNPMLTGKNHLAYLADLNAKAVVTCDQMPEVERAAKQLGIAVLKIVSEPQRGAGYFEIRSASGGSKWGPDGVEGPSEAAAEEIALILPTSGTTSKPKLVPLSHRNLLVSAGNIRATLRLESSDRCLNMMPLFHIHGLVAALLSTFYSGGSIVCAPGFSSAHLSTWLTEQGPTWYSAVPTIHQSVLGCSGQIRDSGRSRLRFIRSSSASLPPKVMGDLEDLFEAPVVEAYGMTEAAHQMASNPILTGSQKPGKVGLPAGPEIMIADDGWNPLNAGSTGEILIRGDNVTGGYLRNDGANRESFRDGWFRTGDQGFFDEDGYLCLTGRTRELINRGGEKIAPREIEEVLLEHPAVSQAVSFSIPHATLGEDVAAAVVIKPDCVTTPEELSRFAAQRIPHFKVPRIIRFIPEIPKGPTGKLQRIGMAETLGIGGNSIRNENHEYIPPDGPLEQEIARIWRETLKIEKVGAVDDFFLLGGDSLLAVEAMARVTARIVEISHVSIYENPRLRDFARVVQSELDDPKQVEGASSGIIPIRVTGTRPPLFCLAGHENQFGIFCRIARQLGEDQPVYGLSYPGLSDERDHYHVTELADDLLARMREVQPQGPYRIFGHCFGGYVAFEMARRLSAAGERTDRLLLMDTYLPAALRNPSCPASDGTSHHRLQFHLAEMKGRRSLAKATYLLDRLRAFLNEVTVRSGNAIFTFFKRRGLPGPAFLRRRDIAGRFAVQEYTPAEYEGTVWLIRLDDNRSDAGLMGWQGWLKGQTKLIGVPFNKDGIGSEECIGVYGPQIVEILESVKQENSAVGLVT